MASYKSDRRTGYITYIDIQRYEPERITREEFSAIRQKSGGMQFICIPLFCVLYSYKEFFLTADC